MLATLMQQYTTDYQADVALGAGFWIFLVIMLAVMVFYVAAMWRIFTKADYPGWHSIIPILNMYTLARIAGRPGWWWVLMCIPCVGSVVSIIVWLDLAKAFGKDIGYGLGLVFLSPIFVPMLAFGSSQYGTPTYGGYYGGGPGVGPAGYGGYGGGGGLPQVGGPGPGGGFGGGFGGGGVQPPGGFNPNAGVGGSPYGQSSTPQLPSLPGIAQPTGSAIPQASPSATPAPHLPTLPGISGTPGISGASDWSGTSDSEGTSGTGTPHGQGWSTPGADSTAEPPTPVVSDGPQPGWYPNPAGGSGLRWWDGNAWTDHVSG
ncbi:MAG: DUF5684 domain-containing protein [Microthrixaceae bacterium]